MQEGQILNQFQELFPHQKNLIEEMKVFFTEKLWHQLTEAILTLIRDEQVLGQGQQLTLLYKDFISGFEQRMDPIKFVKFITRIADFQGNVDQQIEFIDKILEKSVKDEQAIYICQLKKGEFLLEKNNFEEVDKIFKEIVSKLSQQANIDTLVHSCLYKLGYIYNRIRKNYEETYKYGLQFLAYTSGDDISNKEKFQLSLEMTQAILISPTIYNFSELLEQPVLQSIQGSEYSWLFNFLQTYNSGSIAKFNEDMQTYQNQINALPLLKENTKTLQEKIKIQSFLDLAFNQPKNSRTISFEKVAQEAQIQINEVEFLVIRAMALKLIKGSINQVNQTVTVTWILPRVLDQARILSMSKKLEEWQLSLKNVYNLINENHQQE